MLKSLTNDLITTTLCPTPCNGTPEESNALEKPLTASQHRKIASQTLMDWLVANSMSYSQAAKAFRVNNRVIVSVIQGAPIDAKAASQLAGSIPALVPNLEGVYSND